jgi:hypothetical protein
MLSLFSEAASRITYIEEIARITGMGKLGEVEEYQETWRNGSGEFADDREQI